MALKVATEMSSRLPWALIMGSTFAVLLSINLPRELPFEDAFSVIIVIGAAFAIVTYAVGLLVAIRSWVWVRRRRPSR
jgi:hypothetical protein